MVGGLFDERPEFDRTLLAGSLGDLARRGIFIGCSSWKYEGWIGQVYSRERYLARGRFSKRVFESECLREYAETFPTVCGDFAFYQFPGEDYWRSLFSRVPSGFQFAFKVPEQITCKVFPSHQRYGAQAGRENESFLDVQMLREMFLRPLELHRGATSVLIFEFGTFSSRTFEEPAQFLDALDPFLSGLPPEFRYAVEVRNPELLVPDYFECLRRKNVAHVYNAWTRMPDLKSHIAVPGSTTADFNVCRALLRRGRNYEEAVESFAPYTHIQDPNPETRDAMRVLIGRAREEGRTLFLFVNNRLEGNAPLTIISLVEP